jgi:hypothetical protein
MNFAHFIRQFAAALLLPNTVAAQGTLPPTAAMGDSKARSIRVKPDHSGMSTTIPPEAAAC